MKKYLTATKNERKSFPQNWIALLPGGTSEESMCIGNRFDLASQDMPDVFNCEQSFHA